MPGPPTRAALARPAAALGLGMLDEAFVDRQDPRTKRCERVRTIEP